MPTQAAMEAARILRDGSLFQWYIIPSAGCWAGSETPLAGRRRRATGALLTPPAREVAGRHGGDPDVSHDDR